MYNPLKPLISKDIVIFKAPIQGKSNLVRIGCKNSLLDAILFASVPQSEYGKKDENARSLYIKNFYKKLCNVDKYEKDIISSLYNFYNFMDKVEKNQEEEEEDREEELKKIVLELIGDSEEKLFEYELVCEIVSFNSICEIVSKSINEADNLINVKKHIIVSANESFDKIDILKEIPETKSTYLKKLFNNLLNIILDNINFETEIPSENNINLFSRYLDTNILFLDPRSRLPMSPKIFENEGDTSTQDDLKNVIILLYYEELGIYENVCKLVKRNKVEYKFLKSDPVVLTYINMLNNDIDDVNEKIIN